MTDPLTKINSFDSNLGRVVNARQSLFQCVSASGPEQCDGCAAKGNRYLCEEIQRGFDCAEGEGMVQVRLEWLRDVLALLMDFDNAPAPVSTSMRLYALLSAPEALVPNNRANQGGAAR